ncbi:hypothetical protein RFI_13529 [Reticulomyxa filosa]|uniref:Uncharacterized protein n=1 Tax=Reticulomyxa filosa TaxID=46433 RepID=X6NC92_RETFI|nr:hypothetical protein RFI_13529 [Reticulomyxa filosa]|eukprot:ETO23646.1 hypothetical protein RFI_13529 [Reticulomyxa filosa]
MVEAVHLLIFVEYCKHFWKETIIHRLTRTIEIGVLMNEESIGPNILYGGSMDINPVEIIIEEEQNSKDQDHEILDKEPEDTKTKDGLDEDDSEYSLSISESDKPQKEGKAKIRGEVHFEDEKDVLYIEDQQTGARVPVRQVTFSRDIAEHIANRRLTARVEARTLEELIRADEEANANTIEESSVRNEEPPHENVEPINVNGGETSGNGNGNGSEGGSNGGTLRGYLKHMESLPDLEMDSTEYELMKGTSMNDLIKEMAENVGGGKMKEAVILYHIEFTTSRCIFFFFFFLKIIK